MSDVIMTMEEYIKLSADAHDAGIRASYCEKGEREAKQDAQRAWERNDVLVRENAALHTRLRELGHPWRFGNE